VARDIFYASDCRKVLMGALSLHLDFMDLFLLRFLRDRR
jgi:FtsH-binding integral membrane protein